MSALSLVQSLVGLGEEMEAEYDEAIDQEVPSPEALAVILAAIRDARAGLAVLYGKVESGLISSAGEKRFTVDGLGEVEIKRRTKRTAWQHDDLLTVLLARITDEPGVWCDIETGEKNPPVEIGRRITEGLRECVSFGAGKVTGLRKIGIQPDEFCTEQSDGYSVQLPPRQT